MLTCQQASLQWGHNGVLLRFELAFLLSPAFIHHPAGCNVALNVGVHFRHTPRFHLPDVPQEAAKQIGWCAVPVGIAHDLFHVSIRSRPVVAVLFHCKAEEAEGKPTICHRNPHAVVINWTKSAERVNDIPPNEGIVI